MPCTSNKYFYLSSIREYPRSYDLLLDLSEEDCVCNELQRACYGDYNRNGSFLPDEPLQLRVFTTVNDDPSKLLSHGMPVCWDSDLVDILDHLPADALFYKWVQSIQSVISSYLNY
jgi:hypothetical protein